MTDKSKLRTEIKRRIKSIGSDLRNTYSKQIYENLINLPEYVKSKKIFIYISFDSEVHTADIIEHSLKSRKRVFVPYIRANSMEMLEIDLKSYFTTNNLGIVEPVYSRDNLYTGDIDFAVMPLIGYDNNLNRLGRGGGFYDKFLKGRNCIKAAVAFTAQQADKLPVEPHDIKADIIVTEKGIIR